MRGELPVPWRPAPDPARLAVTRRAGRRLVAAAVERRGDALTWAGAAACLLWSVGVVWAG